VALGVEAWVVAFTLLMRFIISSLFSGIWGVGGSVLTAGLATEALFGLALSGGALDTLPRFELSSGGLTDCRAEFGCVVALPGCRFDVAEVGPGRSRGGLLMNRCS
jgi:hypothetical protein